jgi:hypothetical protein
VDAGRLRPPGDTGLPAAPGASPAITALAHGGFEIAWVRNGAVWELGPSGTPRLAANVPVTSGTSPAIAANGTGGFEIAFGAAGSGDLVTVNQDGTVTDTGSKIAGSTSPAITALSTGGYEIAFKNRADGLLWEIGPDGTPRRASNGLGVADGTTPVIAAGPSGGFEIAFHADGLNDLWTVDPGNSNHETHLPMAAGTSPAIAADPGGGFDIAMQAPGSNDLMTLTPSLGNFETSVAMKAGTSPAIAARAVFQTTTIVPNVQGQDQDGAETMITRAGLTVGTITPDHRCIDVAGTVLQQDPDGGTIAPLGSPVSMTVSTGTDAQNRPCVFD